MVQHIYKKKGVALRESERPAWKNDTTAAKKSTRLGIFDGEVCDGRHLCFFFYSPSLFCFFGIFSERGYMSLNKVTNNTGFLFPHDAKSTTKQIAIRILTAISKSLLGCHLFNTGTYISSLNLTSMNNDQNLQPILVT